MGGWGGGGGGVGMSTFHSFFDRMLCFFCNPTKSGSFCFVFKIKNFTKKKTNLSFFNIIEVEYIFSFAFVFVCFFNI